MSKMKKMFKLGSKKHADPTEWTKSDDKLLAAIQVDDLERVEYLMVKKGVTPTKVNLQGLTCLHVAALEGRLELFRFFQEKDVDLTTLDFYGKTPLMCACKAGNLDVMRYLLQLYPETLTSVDHNDLSPLHHACLGGKSDAARHLMQAGASVSAKDKVGRTPLFICARLGNLDLCKDILDTGADINHRDLDRMTALMFAVEYEHLQVVEYLVRRGANTLLTDAGGRNATSYAKQVENDEIIKILENAPSRASWNLDKVEETVVEATVDEEPSEDDTSEVFEPVYMVQSGTNMAQPPNTHLAEDQTDGEFSLEAVAAVEAIMHSTSTPPREMQEKETVMVDVEAYKELEEEHEYLNRELQHVSAEKKQLEEKVQVLERRLSSSDTEGPISPLTAPVQLEEARNQIEKDKEQIEHLEEDVKQLRKQILIDSKPEAERSADDSWNDSDDDLFESEADKKAKSSGEATDIAVIASLRSQVLNLERELEEMKSQPKVESSPVSPERSLLSESATDRDLESLTQYSMLQQAHDAECQQLQDRIETLLSENFTIKKELTEAVEQKIETEFSKDEVEKKVEDLQQSMAYLERDLDSINSMLGTAQSTSSNPNELESIKQSVVSVRDKVKAPGTYSQQIDKDVAEIQQERDQLRLSLHQYKLDNEKLNNDLSDIHSQVQALEGLAVFNTELTNENDRLKEEINRIMSSENSSSRDADQKAMAQLTMQLQQENNDLKSENRSLTAQISEIEDSLKTTIAQREQERLQGGPVDKEKNDLKAEVELLKQKVEEQKAELHMSKPSHPEMSPDVDELRSQITHLKKTVSQQDETIMELVQQSTKDAQLRHDYERLENESEIMKNKMINFQALFAGHGEEANKRIKELEQEIQGLRDENANMQSKQPEEVQAFSASDKESWDKQVEELKRAKKDLEADKQHLEAAVSQYELEMMKVRREADKAVSLKEEKDLVEDEKLALEIQVAQLATVTLAAETSANKVADLEKEKTALREEYDVLSREMSKLIQERDDLSKESLTAIQERDELLQAIPSLKEEIGKLEMQQSESKTVEVAIDELQKENAILRQENSTLGMKIADHEAHSTKSESSLSDLKGRIKELEELLEREQSATIMTVLDGRTAEQKSTENNLKEQIHSLTQENEQLRSEAVKLKENNQNGNAEDLVMLSALTLQSSTPNQPNTQNVDNHRLGYGLGSSLKMRSEEFHFKEIEEENERLKTEIEKLKSMPYSESQVEPMRQQLLMMQDKLDIMERRHRDVVSTYRAHLLRAVRGHMDSEVQQALMNIIKIRQAPEVDV